MDIRIYDDGEEPQTPLHERLLELEEKIKPSLRDRVLMWLKLKPDHRLTKKPWRYP